MRRERPPLEAERGGSGVSVRVLGGERGFGLLETRVACLYGMSRIGWEEEEGQTDDETRNEEEEFTIEINIILATHCFPT